MCTARPLTINDHNISINRTQNVIESENYIISIDGPTTTRTRTTSTSTRSTPTTVHHKSFDSLQPHPFESNARKKKKTKSRKSHTTPATNVVQFERKDTENTETENCTTRDLILMPTNSNDSLQSAYELNLASVSESSKHDRFQMHKSLASRAMIETETKNKSKIVNTIAARPVNGEHKSPSIKTIDSIDTITATTASTTTTTTFVATATQNIVTSTATATATVKSTIQSVFLDYLNNNINGTTDLQPIDEPNLSLNTTNDDRKDFEPSPIDSISAEDETILSRTDRSVHVQIDKRKKLLRNDTDNLERIERSANLSLSKATKRIQLLIKGRFLQLLPDGTINGTQSEESDYSKYPRFGPNGFFFR